MFHIITVTLKVLTFLPYAVQRPSSKISLPTVNREILDIFYNLSTLLMTSKTDCTVKGNSLMNLGSNSSFITYQLGDLKQLNIPQLILTFRRSEIHFPLQYYISSRVWYIANICWIFIEGMNPSDLFFFRQWR